MTRVDRLPWTIALGATLLALGATALVATGTSAPPPATPGPALSALASGSATLSGEPLYAQHLASFVGGYTVAGSAILAHTPSTGRTTVNVSSFAVAQECVCEARATAHGIVAAGANDGNAFLLVISREDDGRWYAEQTSVGAEPAYKATMRYGVTPGGAHSAVGHLLGGADVAAGTQKTFRADQSAVGCDEGVGARTCEAVCGAYGLPWDQIRAKCFG